MLNYECFRLDVCLHVSKLVPKKFNYAIQILTQKVLLIQIYKKRATTQTLRPV
jgi:hypothetical protein